MKPGALLKEWFNSSILMYVKTEDISKQKKDIKYIHVFLDPNGKLRRVLSPYVLDRLVENQIYFEIHY